MFKFEKLEVWNESIAFTREVYRVTRSFPADERFGLTSQLRRSAVSIAANLAEGSGRTSRKDFLRFVEMSYGSLMESVSHFAIALQETFITAEQHTHLYDQAERVGRMLSGLRRHLRNEGQADVE